ncbi:hypothetical protein HYV43_07215 [Candidatus Micrarchaeota archaeon]|nr:hypothetical protein [Candidatus Micrarchaeota archaeon]
MRATIVLDEHMAAYIRQMFGGNLSKGISTLLKKQMDQERKMAPSGFGLLKGHGKALRLELKKLREEDERDREALYR